VRERNSPRTDTPTEISGRQSLVQQRTRTKGDKTHCYQLPAAKKEVRGKGLSHADGACVRSQSAGARWWFNITSRATLLHPRESGRGHKTESSCGTLTQVKDAGTRSPRTCSHVRHKVGVDEHEQTCASKIVSAHLRAACHWGHDGRVRGKPSRPSSLKNFNAQRQGVPSLCVASGPPLDLTPGITACKIGQSFL